jgi:hypothetical protein
MTSELVTQDDRVLVQQQDTDLAMLRLENETMMAACEARPRNLSHIKDDLGDALQAFPELAELAVYEKPVGKGPDGKMKFATGLSIRAAETLAEAYGFNRIRSSCTPLGDHAAKVEAMFTDYQRARVWQDSGVVSKSYKTSGGAMKRHADDRFWNVVVRAEASKRVREVILRSVSAPLKAWFLSECRKQQAKLLTDEKLGEIVAYFKSLGCSLEQLETIVGRPKTMGWTNRDRQRLMGIATALKDNETTINEVIARADDGDGSPHESPANQVLADEVEPREVTSEAEKTKQVATVVKDADEESQPDATEKAESDTTIEDAKDLADSPMVKDAAAVFSGCETADQIDQEEATFLKYLMSDAEKKLVSAIIAAKRKEITGNSTKKSAVRK